MREQDFDGESTSPRKYGSNHLRGYSGIFIGITLGVLFSVFLVASGYYFFVKPSEQKAQSPVKSEAQNLKISHVENKTPQVQPTTSVLPPTFHKTVNPPEKTVVVNLNQPQPAKQVVFRATFPTVPVKKMPPVAKPKVLALNPAVQPIIANPNTNKKVSAVSDNAEKASINEDDGEKISLPGEFSYVCTDVKGKYLFFLIDKLLTIAVFDVQNRKFASFISLPDKNSKMAVGADSLFVTSPETNTIKRFCFPDFKLALEKKIDEEEYGKIAGIGISSGQPSQLLVLTNNSKTRHVDISFLNPHSLAMYEMEINGKISYSENADMAVSASPNGGTYFIKELPNGSIYTIKLAGNCANVTCKGGSSMPLFSASGFGKHIFYNGSIMNEDFVLANFTYKPVKSTVSMLFIPSQREGIYLGTQAIYMRKYNKVIIKVYVFCSDFDRSIYDLEIPGYSNNSASSLSNKIVYLPDAGVLATAEADMKSFKLRNIDLKKSLDAKGEKYMIVLSVPPQELDNNGRFNYKIKMLSNIKDIKYEALSTPQGMKISEDGNVTWECPDSNVLNKESVIIGISGSGKNIFHSFVLNSEKNGTALKQRREELSFPSKKIKLPAEPADLVVGGGGRYIVLFLKELRKMAVFDMESKDIVKYIDAPYNEIAMAASADKLAVAEKQGKRISLFHLRNNDYRLIREVKISGKLYIKDIGLGYASQGPLLIGWTKGLKDLDTSGYRFYDLDTLSPVSEDAKQFQCYRDVMHARSSAEGRTYGIWSSSHSPSGGDILIYGSEPYYFHEHSSFGYIVPANDCGQILFTEHGIYGPKMKPYKPEIWSQEQSYLPTYNSDMFLSYKPLPYHSDNTTSPLKLNLSLDSDISVKIANLNKSDLNTNNWLNTDFTNDKRLICSPAYNALAIFPFGSSYIRLVEFDLEKAIRHVDENYLFVASQPVRSIIAGTKYAYQIEVKSKSDKIKYELETGPAGMSLSQDGLLSWTFPKNKRNVNEPVVVKLSSNGKSIYHSFRVSSKASYEPLKLDTPKAVALKESDLNSLSASAARFKLNRKDIASRFMDSVVVVGNGNGYGTGFFIGSKGYVLTCAHCVNPTLETEVAIFNDKSDREKTVIKKGTIVCLDERMDLAIVKVDDINTAHYVKFDLLNSPETGDDVTIIGNPGIGGQILSCTMTNGIVSNPKRIADNLEFIQTNAAMNPGNSGGPVFNEYGNVIGIVQFKANIDSVGFALASKNIVEFLKNACKNTAKTAKKHRE